MLEKEFRVLKILASLLEKRAFLIFFGYERAKLVDITNCLAIHERKFYT
jgi:hypothetical protein